MKKTKNQNINNKQIIDFDKNQFIKFLKSYENIKIYTKIEKNLKNISNGTMISKIHDLNTNLNTNLNEYIDSYKKILKIFLIKDGYNENKLNTFLDKKSINSLSTIQDFNNIQHFKNTKKQNNKYKIFQNINRSIYLLKCFIIICKRLKKSNLNTCIQEYIDKYEKLIKLKILNYDNEDYDYIDYILFIYGNEKSIYFFNKNLKKRRQIKSDFNMNIYNYYVYIINIYTNTKIKNVELFNPINFYNHYIKWFKEFFYAKRSVSMLNNDLFITFLNNKTDELKSKTSKK